MTSLDQERLVDFAEDGTTLGVQFLKASRGIDLRNVPQREQVASLLTDLNLQILA